MSDVFTFANLEQAINQIKSVTAVRINAGETGLIEEIHILAGLERNPKQIVRDVESLLAAQFGMQVDHKKISVVQVENDEGTPSSLVPEFTRPRIAGISLQTIKSTAHVKVELTVGDDTIEGTAQGPSSSYNKQRLFVEATVKALVPLTYDTSVYVPEDVTITHFAKYKIAQVVLTLVSAAGEQPLVGCALVRGDEGEAVVKATLDAVNRKLRRLEIQ